MDATPHILIVDDQRDIREPLGRYLEKHGLRVSLAAGAAEAREFLRRSAVDLVILDIMMPGEDGLSLCRRIVNRHGGSITARNNPDHGTTFSFTLPAAAVTVA